MSQTIDDLVILGRASPETLQDGRTTVCTAGWSHSRGYVRLYPTRMDMNKELKRWNVVSVEVQSDPPSDNRNESYKIAGSRSEWDDLHEKITVRGEWDKQKQRDFVQDIPRLCSQDLSDLRYSLGIVKPEILDHRIDPPDPDKEKEGLSKNNRKTLYVKYECENCKLKTQHQQHCIEWGMYEFWRNHGDKYDDEEVVNALKMYDDDWDVYFLLGNLSHHRTAYVIISVLRFKKEDSESLDRFTE